MEAILSSNLQSDDDNHCPRTHNCTKLVSFDIGKEPSYVAIVSSSLSCLGSVLIFVAFLTLKDLRTGSQKIITFLALADFISAAGYIVGSTNFLIHFDETDTRQCKAFKTICLVQASITSWSSLCSFAWTLILAFYFYLVIVYNRKALAVKLMPVYHLLAWVVPLFIIVPLAATRKLGYAPYAASNWCFVKSAALVSNASDSIHPEEIGFILLAGKFWEISTYFAVAVVYTHIVCHLSKLLRRRRSYLPVQAISIVGQAEKRLVYIPVFFIILRIWGTIQFLSSIASSRQIHNGCISKSDRDMYFAFGILQAIGDPGQGWGNAILYVFLSPVVRERLCLQLFSWPWMQKLQTALSASEHGSSQRDGHQQPTKDKKAGDCSRQDATAKEEESAVLSLDERMNRAKYGSTDYRDTPINSS